MNDAENVEGARFNSAHDALRCLAALLGRAEARRVLPEGGLAPTIEIEGEDEENSLSHKPPKK